MGVFGFRLQLWQVRCRRGRQPSLTLQSKSARHRAASAPHSGCTAPTIPLMERLSRKSPWYPFVSVDTEGVGALMEWAVEKGRAARPGLKVGICGEHGGDPASVEFCHATNLNYVSCSPFRVPIARLAAAQAAVRGRAAGSDQR